jgi:hypothetical protein
MQEIAVKSVIEKQPRTGKGSPFYIITAEDGAEFTCFDTKMKDVAAGTRLRIEPKVSGKYINIEKWEVVSAPQPQPHSDSSDSQRYLELARQKRIDMQAEFALDQVGQNLRSGIVPVEMERRFKYWQALDKMLDAYLDKKPAPALEVKTPEPATKAKSTLEVKTSPVENKFVNIGQVLTKALKLVPPVNPHELTQALGGELKDITDYDAAWQKAQEISAQKKG